MGTFWLGTHMPNWLSSARVPLFLSARRMRRYQKHHKAAAPWALDSGGFSELGLWGEWRTTPAQYVREVRAWSVEVGMMAWAAPQDWMCEPIMLAKTGLNVPEHQRRTVASFLTLRELAPEQPWAPVLQGWNVGDYVTHARAYEAAGVDLTAHPVVGVGSVCRRQATGEAVEIFSTLAGAGLRLHGFGVKTQGLPTCAPFLVSADSQGWSYRGRMGGDAGSHCPQHPPGRCGNCLAFALQWGERQTRAARWAAP